MDRDVRRYDGERDFEAVHRIWLETRWLDDTDEHRRGLEDFLAGGAAEVGLLDGEAECLVHRTAGTIHVDATPLPLCAISAVTTSHIGRRRRFASTLTARALRHGVTEGAEVGALGMFEQGFYDRFGFGTGSYVDVVRFDPASLRVDHVPYRAPVRLTADDAADMHRALVRRLPHHGSVVLDAPRLMSAELRFLEHPFALGYRDETGELTHFFVGSLKEENGPFDIEVLAYRTGPQLLELLRLLRQLADQFHLVELAEPAHVQLQSLLGEPMRQRNRSRGASLEAGTRAHAWFQYRILDLAPCIGARRWPGEPVEFDLRLTDPVSDFLPDDGEWRGIAGDWTVTLGDPSSLTARRPGDRAQMRCSVGTFTRLWFGVLPASGLALTDGLDAPAELCDRLDRALCAPPFLPGFNF